MEPITMGLLAAGAGQTAGGLFQAFVGLKGLKMQKKAFENALEQQKLENQRWEKREKERDDANKIIANSASNWSSLSERM